MGKKYKLFNANINPPNLNGGKGFPPVQMPVLPLINPFTSNISMASPILPTVQPTISTYPPPLAVGPKINILPKSLKRGTVVINTPTGLTVSISGKEADLAKLLTMASHYKKTPLSPISDDLPNKLDTVK